MAPETRRMLKMMAFLAALFAVLVALGMVGL